MFSKRTLAVFLAAPLLFAIVACGGGSDNKSTSSTPTGADQPAGNSGGSSATTVPLPSAAVTVQTGTNIGDACSVISKQDASSALGEPVGDGTGTTVTSQTLGAGINASVSGCDFDAASGNSVNVVLWKITGSQSSQTKQIFQQVICAGKESISGLGDVACWYDSSHDEIQVLKGSTFVDITISASNKGDALKALASKAASKF